MLFRPTIFVDDESIATFGVIDDPVDVPIVRTVEALRLDNNVPSFRGRRVSGIGISSGDDPWIPRCVQASSLSSRYMMSVSRRYSPEVAPGESSVFGFDFSPIVPSEVGLTWGSLSISTNTVPPVVSNDFVIGDVLIFGRILYCRIRGGVSGKDYLLTWTALDDVGNIWPRTAMVLCSLTS